MELWVGIVIALIALWIVVLRSAKSLKIANAQEFLRKLKEDDKYHWAALSLVTYVNRDACVNEKQQVEIRTALEAINGARRENRDEFDFRMALVTLGAYVNTCRG